MQTGVNECASGPTIQGKGPQEALSRLGEVVATVLRNEEMFFFLLVQMESLKWHFTLDCWMTLGLKKY